MSGEGQQYQQIGYMMGEILASAPRLVALPRREVIRETITAYIDEAANGHIATFAQQYQISLANARDWRERGTAPQHGIFLQMCLSLEISPVCWLTGEILKMITAQEFTPRDPLLITKPKRKIQRKFDAESVQNALKTALQSPERPGPSMAQVAKSLGYSHGLLFRKFPELCQAISARHREEVEEEQYERLRGTLEAALQSSEGFPPSMRQVAKNLKSHHGSLFKKFPELCQAIATRYLDAMKKQRTERTQKLCEEVRQATLRIHAQGIYPSTNKVQASLTNGQTLQEPQAFAMWKATMQELGWKR